METYSVHIIESSICLAAFYVVYLFSFRRENGFKFIRYYLLASLIISVLLPFNDFSLRFPQSITSIENIKPKTTDSKYIEGNFQIQDNQLDNLTKSNISKQPLDYFLYAKWIYFVVLISVLLRFLIGLCTIVFYYKQSLKDIRGNIIVLKNEKLNRSFSFLNLIFINPKGLNENELKSVIAHEYIHVSQYHTVDLIVIELLSAVMWFNPFVWLMRKSLRQVHEYLADEGVLNIGFDRLEYQTLLVNQVAESRLISLASNFNHSQIKNRILMMTKIKSDNVTKLKLLALVPVTTLLFLTIACVNGQNKTNVVTTVEPVKMNVLYLGIDNPIKIAASGHDASELEVTFDNGTISGKNGDYVIHPEKSGPAIVTVKCQGKEIQKTYFRVKIVPDPIAKISVLNGNKKSGEISKKELLASGGIVIEMQNFDFDLHFNVVSFVMSATLPNSYTVREEISKSEKFSNQQIELINSMILNQKLAFEEITVIGPDGVKRQLSPMVFRITAD